MRIETCTQDFIFQNIFDDTSMHIHDRQRPVCDARNDQGCRCGTYIMPLNPILVAHYHTSQIHLLQFQNVWNQIMLTNFNFVFGIETLSNNGMNPVH